MCTAVKEQAKNNVLTPDTLEEIRGLRVQLKKALGKEPQVSMNAYNLRDLSLILGEFIDGAGAKVDAQVKTQQIGEALWDSLAMPCKSESLLHLKFRHVTRTRYIQGSNLSHALLRESIQRNILIQITSIMNLI